MSDAAKDLIFDEEARAKLRQGLDEITQVVAVTLGPKGRGVGLQASWGTPSVTSDGASIAKEVELADQYAQMGVMIAKEVSGKMKEKCGDGTTTSLLLLGALAGQGLKLVSAGHSPIEVKLGMEAALEAVLANLASSSHPVQGKEEILSIATASASGNAALGSLIAEAFEKVGKEGVITIEEGKTTETTIDIVQGMQFDRGYASAYFCTNAESMSVELENCKVLVTDKKISSIQEILPVLQAVAATGTPLLIIADDIEGDALSTLVINRLRGTLKVAAVKAPGFGDRKEAMLQDIAILTGATLISEKAGILLKDADASSLGSVERLHINKDKTTLIGGSGEPETIQIRAGQLAHEISQSKNSYDREHLETRRAKLLGGVGVIRVGGSTEPEVKEKKQKLQDSLNSAKAASRGGVVTGGGVALLRASDAVNSLQLEGGAKLGAEALRLACHAPFRQIVSNAGKDSSLLLEEVLRKGSSFGFNALTEKVEDLVKTGIVDPREVVENALKYAVSAAATTLLTEVLIGDAAEEEQPAAKKPRKG